MPSPTKVIPGHMRPILCQNHSSRFVYGPILMKICMNANTIKTQFFYEIIYELKCHFYVMEKFCDFFTLRPSDLITTLTYVLIYNFCPCFSIFHLLLGRHMKFIIWISTTFLYIYIILNLILFTTIFHFPVVSTYIVFIKEILH